MYDQSNPDATTPEQHDIDSARESISTLQLMESLAEALRTLKAVRLQTVDVFPVWQKLNNASAHIERQLKELLAE